MLYLAMDKDSEVYFVIGESKEEIEVKVQEKLRSGFSAHETKSKNLEEIMQHVKEAEPCSECGMNTKMYYTWYGERGIPAGRAYQCISAKCGKHEGEGPEREVI
jgi:hypothetical protein